jgi:acyl-CoA thioester hydrolase
MSNSFTKSFTAQPEHIDIYGHVNNAVWVQWMEDMANSHWSSVAPQEHLDTYAWFVTRHEIDYRGNIAEGESVEATTFIPEGPSGARFDRRVDFRNGDGKVIVSARTTWAMIDRATGRLMRVPAEVAAPFMPPGSDAD